MKFRCDRDVLSEALQVVQRGVSSRPGIPALTGVLVEARSDGTLTLTTTDLEMSARLSIEVQVHEEGVALVPARLVGDTVKSLSEAPVDVDADLAQATIRCAAYEGALRLLPAEDFPASCRQLGRASWRGVLPSLRQLGRSRVRRPMTRPGRSSRGCCLRLAGRA